MNYLDQFSSQYRIFLSQVNSEMQAERQASNRRMISVLLWCFIFPLVIGSLFLLMISFRLIPFSARTYVDLVYLGFPVVYSLFFLSSQVIKDLPGHFKRGGVGTLLLNSQKDEAWRTQVCKRWIAKSTFSSDDWKWIIANFKLDLERLKERNKYLTALAGAVFYLIMQGLDSIQGAQDNWVVSEGSFKHPVLKWLLGPIAAELGQYVGLALFLVLLYLSGRQAYIGLAKYLECAELLGQFSDKSVKGSK